VILGTCKPPGQDQGSGKGKEAYAKEQPKTKLEVTPSEERRKKRTLEKRDNSKRPQASVTTKMIQRGLRQRKRTTCRGKIEKEERSRKR